MTAHLLNGLEELQHTNGRPLVAIHGPTTLERRGGTVAFSVLNSEGSVVPFEEVVAFAGSRGVSVRGGCFCNPGCDEVVHRIGSERARECRHALHGNYSKPAFRDCSGGSTGAVRASVGIPTIPSDIDRLIETLEHFRF